MIVRVTTLGAADGDAAGAATAVVKYLDGRAPAAGGSMPGALPNLPPSGGTKGVVGYYADSVEGPGRWLGRGVTGMRLEGQVDPEQFRRVLLGQHAVTGEQLLGPNGSAVRADRGSRQKAPVSRHGEPDEALTLAQAATLLGVSDRYLRRLADETRTLRVGQAKATSAKETPPDTPSTFLDAKHDDGGKRWTVTRAEVERFAAERKPPAAVVGFDLTFSVPKSVSILWARADRAQQAQIVAAIEGSVAAGMAYIEKHAAWVGRGKSRRRAKGIVAAAYVHATSRALDPQLHIHVVVANMAESPTGRILALDGRALYAHAKTAGYLASAQLRHELATTLGVEWEDVERGLADVTGVPDAAITEMSKRSTEIDQLTEQLGVDSLAARQAAAFATRAAKERAIDLDALRPSWHERLDRVGFDARAAAACCGRQAAPLLVTDDDRARLFALLTSDRGVTEMASTFDRRDVIQYVAQWSGDRLDARQITDLADEWLATDTVVTLETDRREGRNADVIRLDDGRVVGAVADLALYTTRQVLDIEQRLLAGYQAGRHTGTAVLAEPTVEAVLAERPQLGVDQVEMVRAVTRSGHQVQCILGPAGSGKTTAIEAAVRAWEAAGFAPIATAVQGTHAELLGSRTGIEARTVASLLRAAETGAITLRERSVIIVDESSVLGNRDLLALIDLCRSSGAAMRLVGDPAQHSAVAAGGAWRRLLEDYPRDRAELQELRRQVGDDMADVRLALTDYREDRVTEAIDRLRSGGRVVEADSPDEVLDALVADWYADRQRRLADPTLAASTMTADHHAERRELNQRARAMLIADGTLAGPSLDLPGISLRAGDEVIAVQGHRTLRPDGAPYRDHVRTAERGIVVEVRLCKREADSAIVVDFERRGRVLVSHAHLTHRVRPGVVGRLAHSYAMTTYAAQGETYEAGRGLATEQAFKAGVYVALSRGRTDAKLYMLRRRDLLPAGDDPHMPRLETEIALIDEVTARLRAQQADQLATDVDPASPEVARLRQTHSLAELDALVAGPASPESAVARRALVEELTAIASRARLHPEPMLVARLGLRPAGGLDRRLWDTAVGEVAIFRARWDIGTIAEGHGSTWALGPELAGDARDHYATAESLLHGAEVAYLANLPTPELTRRRRLLIGALAGEADDVATDVTTVADLAGAEAQYDAVRRRLDDLRSAPRSNLQGIELATRDLADAELAVAQVRVRFQEASELRSARAGDPDGHQDVAHRLTLIEGALGRQAASCIAPPAPYVEAVLGVRPQTHRGRSLWDRGAIAIERYRHIRLGLTPADGPLTPTDDVLAMAVGGRPHGTDASAFDEVETTALAMRTAVLLGALAQEAPAIPAMDAETHRLARRPLPHLLRDLEDARVADARLAVAARRPSVAGPPRRRVRRPPPEQGQLPFPEPEPVAETQGSPPEGAAAALEIAVILREISVEAATLGRPPPWLRDDAARRVATYPPGHDGLDPVRLAKAYGTLAAYAERVGQAGAERIGDILDVPAPDDELQRFRDAVLDDLNVDAAVELGVGLSP